MAFSVGLFGFGKTGKIVAREVIVDKACKLAWVIRKSNKNAGDYASSLFGLKTKQGLIFQASNLNFRKYYHENPVDIIIDFSSAQALPEYEPAAACGMKVVSAISRYEPGDIARLKAMSRKTAVLYSPNITIGVNFLIVASRILKKIAPKVDIEIVEEHFRRKKEVSGTALRIADLLDLSREHHVNAIRVGGIIGKHEVIFGFPNQTIRIIHESISRAAFAKGAIHAAKWLLKKKRGMYTMEQVMSSDFARHSARLSKADLLPQGR